MEGRCRLMGFHHQVHCLHQHPLHQLVGESDHLVHRHPGMQMGLEPGLVLQFPTCYSRKPLPMRSSRLLLR